MELGAYLGILWQRKWVIAVTVAVTVTIVVIGTLMATPKYVASTMLRVATAAGGSVEYVDYMYAERLMNTYTEIATSGPVLEELVQRLGLDEPPQIEVEIIADTELMQVTLEDPNPILAREAANALAEILVFQSGEAFRRLRTNLFTLDHDAALQTLLITSAEPREGKSTIVANLAFAIAQSGRKVIVVDGALRRPTLHKIFDLSNEIGLSSILKQEATLDEAVQDSKIAGIQALTSGPLPPHPAELPSSPQMTALLEQLAQQFDMVVLDTPSLLAVTDAAVLAPIVDAVVLVVGRAQARRESVRVARQQLADVKARSIGIVVNRAKQDSSYYYYHRTPTQYGE